MTESSIKRYLDLLKASLLNELYIENEVRLLYVFATLAAGQQVSQDTVRNISQRLPAWVKAVSEARAEGRPWWVVNVETGGMHKSVNLRDICEFSHTMIGRKRLDNIEHCLDTIRSEGIPGDLIETGVWRGGASIFMRGYLAAHDMHERRVWVADSFEGLPKPTLPQDSGYDFSVERTPILAVSLDEVQENFRRYGLLDEQVVFVKGWFKDTLHKAPIDRIAVARLDGDLYESTMDALTALYGKIEPGGYVIIDDYGWWPGCAEAVQDFRQMHGIEEEFSWEDFTGIHWQKMHNY